MAKSLVDTEKFEKRINGSKTGKTSKKKSPPKRGKSNRIDQICFVDSDEDELFDSDTEMPIRTTRRATRRSNRAIRSISQPAQRTVQSTAYDPNTIVIDCDDEFFGGPSVAFSRNIAQANAISNEDKQSLKVSVKVNNTIEQFELNAVSIICVCVFLLFVNHSIFPDIQLQCHCYSTRNYRR